RSGLGILERMVQVNKIMEAKQITLGCRIGINTGLVVAGEMGDRGERDFTVMGDTVNTASRLESNAQVNTILVSESTREAAGDIFNYEALEPIQVKGKIKPLKTFRVHGVLKERVERWERDTLAKSRAYIGREAEWKHLEKFIADYFASDGSSGMAVAGLRADGGMGKSRMAYEFLNRGPCSRGLILKGKTISYAAAPYWLFSHLVKNMMGASEGDAVETVRLKWQELFEKVKSFERLSEDKRQAPSAALAEHAEYLAYLLGVSTNPDAVKAVKPEKLKNLIFESFRLFLEAAAALPDEKEVVYVLLDDLHWIDVLSRELIDYLLDSLRPARPLLFVTMYRPDYQTSEKWKTGDNFFELTVKPLSREESKRMVEGMLRGLVLPDHLTKLIFEKSGGNPFYIEEITYSLIEQEVLISEEVQEGNEVWLVNPSSGEVNLPDSLHGMVQTRIDKLDEEARKLLLEASVIGMDFGSEFLGELHGRAGGESEDISGLLRALTDARLIVPSEGGGGNYFVFGNVLIKEVSYNTLLNFNKTVLHGLIGECIEEMYKGKDVPEDEHYRLAFHFEKGEKADKAIPYLESAGDQCATRFAARAAIDCFSRLLVLLEQSSLDSEEKTKKRLANMVKLAQAEYLAGELKGAYEHFAECGKLAQQARQFETLCSVLTSAGEIERIREHHDKAMAFFEKSLEISEKLELEQYVADNLVNIGIVKEEQGEYGEAMDFFQQALARAVTDEQRQNISYYIFQRS
ncbi:MAG TPA: adenylate/guanylate cyclase domain-containing protein, partial [Candidatus Glassbacteria bacterium]|nr:adenylate/guanylate cyclase domain-containing protein [Candidatus Glassbacteria bacterium]